MLRTTGGDASGRLSGVGLGPALHLLWADVLLVRGDPPAVPEGVDHLAVAVTPEGVHRRHAGRGAGLDGALEGGVGVFDVEVKRAGRAAERLRRAGSHVRKLVAEHQAGVADLKLGVPD